MAKALELLRTAAEKKAWSATSRPQRARVIGARSRDIPAGVERAVWERDQGQCAFEGHGRRCEERSFLEFHHLTPWIVGGVPTLENVALRCQAHNAYEAGVYFAPIRAAMAARGAPAPDP